VTLHHFQANDCWTDPIAMNATRPAGAGMAGAGDDNSGSQMTGQDRPANHDRPPRMVDIARLAGVSVSTVSRALSDNPLIPLSTREEVQRIAARHGYVVNQSARSLRLRRTDTIAVVLPIGHEVGQLITDPFFLLLFGHLADVITSRGLQVLITRQERTGKGWLDRIIRAQRQDGIIVVGQSDQHATLQAVSQSYRAMVVWGGEQPDATYCTVGTDNLEAGRIVARHLTALSRRRIVFLGPHTLPEISLRRAGLLEGLAQTPGAIEVACAHAPFNHEGARSAMAALIASGARFDAVFAASDVIALAAMEALADAGRTVPGDVSVVGFDDITMAARANPPLTTIAQDLPVAARLMVDKLQARIAGEDAPGGFLAPRLMVRGSCGGGA
jgi:DNA-binding LacI/PurR family transcriptional regulator